MKQKRKQTNLQHYFPGYDLEDFRMAGVIGMTCTPGCRTIQMDCDRCPARAFCDAHPEWLLCYPTFRAWAMEEYTAQEGNIPN